MERDGSARIEGKAGDKNAWRVSGLLNWRSSFENKYSKAVKPPFLSSKGAKVDPEGKGEMLAVGSFFKNPVVSAEQCRDIIGRDPSVVHYPLPDGSVKLAAGWLIDACGWKGKSIGRAGVYDKQALVIVNRGGASGAEVLMLARAIQESVYGRFGIRLEPEPMVV